MGEKQHNVKSTGRSMHCVLTDTTGLASGLCQNLQFPFPYGGSSSEVQRHYSMNRLRLQPGGKSNE